MKCKLPFNLAIFFLLAYHFSAGIYAQDTLDWAYQLDTAETTDGDKVTIKYSLELGRLNTSNVVDSTQYPHYRIFICYGDGTFEKDIIIDTIENEKIQLSGDKIIYNTAHTYYFRPTQAVFASVAKIKTTDTDPPPRMNKLNIHTWLEETLNNLNQVQRIIVGALKTLEHTAEDVRNDLEESGELVPENDNLRLHFHLGPVPLNDYIGVLEVKGINNNVKSGSIFVHYNLSSYTPDDELLIQQNEIRHWKNEEIQTYKFGDLYPNADPLLMDFTDVIRIDFEDLDVNEVRRIILPFECPASLDGNFNDPVYFHAVVIDHSLVDAYINGMDGDIIFTTNDKEILTENVDTGIFPGKRSDKAPVGSPIGLNSEPYNRNVNKYEKAVWQEEGFAFNEFNEPSSWPAGLALSSHAGPVGEFYIQEEDILGASTVRFLPMDGSSHSIRPEEYLVVSDTDSPLSQAAEILERFRNQLDGLGGSIISDLLVLDYIRKGHDPNSLELSPDCFGTSPKKIEGVVNVENYGFNGVKEITIKIRLNGQVRKESFSLFKSSFGESAQLDTYIIRENGEDYYVVGITGVYLPGILELAIEGGFFPIGDTTTLANRGEMEELRLEVMNKYGAISQGHIVFQGWTRHLSGSMRPLILEAEVIFEDQAPIKTADTIQYNPSLCGGVGPFFRMGARLGYNYMLPFENYNPNYNFSDNYTLGVYFDASPHYNSRLYYRLEANYNRWGFEDSGTALRHTNIEIAPLVRYALGRRWSIGAGPSFLREIKWELEENKPLPFTFDKNQVGSVIDLAYNNLKRNIGIGLRGQYYPGAIQVDSDKKSMKGAQLYLSVRLF